MAYISFTFSHKDKCQILVLRPDVKPDLLGGRLYGSSEHSQSVDEIEPAKTVLCFMVSSLHKKWSSVVRLLPLVNPKASDLLPITVQVIKDVEQSGLFVDLIVSENYPLNVNLFKLIGNNKKFYPVCLTQIVPNVRAT